MSCFIDNSLNIKSNSITSVLPSTNFQAFIGPLTNFYANGIYSTFLPTSDFIVYRIDSPTTTSFFSNYKLESRNLLNKGLELISVEIVYMVQGAPLLSANLQMHLLTMENANPFISSLIPNSGIMPLTISSPNLHVPTISIVSPFYLTDNQTINFQVTFQTAPGTIVDFYGIFINSNQNNL